MMLDIGGMLLIAAFVIAVVYFVGSMACYPLGIIPEGGIPPEALVDVVISMLFWLVGIGAVLLVVGLALTALGVESPLVQTSI
jgi:hypothetical protein